VCRGPWGRAAGPRPRVTVGLRLWPLRRAGARLACGRLGSCRVGALADWGRVGFFAGRLGRNMCFQCWAGPLGDRSLLGWVYIIWPFTLSSISS
jgi:hypothetical protein